MLNHKRQSTKLLTASSSRAQLLTPHQQPKIQLSNQNQNINPKFKLPLSNTKLKQQTQPSERLTDRTQKTNKRIDLGGISSSRSSHRLKHCEDIIEAHTQSIHFYTNELKRRQAQFIKKKDELQKEHIERVYYLEKLLKAEINKNVKLEQQYRRIKHKQKSVEQSKQLLLKPMRQFSNQQIVQLFNELKKEMDIRYECDADISRIKDAKGRMSNDLVLSYSKTDQSLLLGEVTRHF